MRTMLVGAVFALAAALPGGASADVFITPYLGVNFGGRTVDPRPNLGVALTWLGASGLGVEADVALIPDFFEPRDLDIDALGGNRVTTVMANVVYERRGRRIQPYVSAGGGLLRSRVASFGEFFDAVENGLGVNAGAGVRLGAGRFSLRGDIRYFRSLTGVDERVLQDALSDFAFWRAATGLSIGF